ncbi:MAG: CHAT domain-containing protein [Cyanobacteria bacterium P01_G01_bin.54]
MRRFWRYIWVGVITGLLLVLWSLPLRSTPNSATDPNQATEQCLAPTINTYSYEQLDALSQQCYQYGQYQPALDWLEQARVQAQGDGDRLGELLAHRNLALIHTRLGNWPAAEAHLDAALGLTTQLPMAQQAPQYAAIAELQGFWAFQQGRDQVALGHWQAATQQYAALEDELGTTRNQLHQAHALRYLGLYYQADQMLEALAEQLKKAPQPTATQAQALKQLSEVQRITGKLEEALDSLSQSIEIAQALQLPELEVSNQILLGHLAQNCYADDEQATSASSGCDDIKLESPEIYYRAAAKTANEKLCSSAQGSLRAVQLPHQTGADCQPESRLIAHLNEFNWWVHQKQQEPAQTLLNTLEQDDQLSNRPDTRTTLNVRIQVAQGAMELPGLRPPPEIAYSLTDVIQKSRQLGDPRIEAYALRTLGHLYEQHQNEQQQTWKNAASITQQSISIALQQIRAKDLLYQSQWQLGRIFKSQFEKYKQQQLEEQKTIECEEMCNQAIQYYSQAVQTLSFIRGDLVAMSSDVQFSFREKVEPLYREYVDLLLQPNEQDQDKLQAARKAIEALQLAELDDFFKDACLDAEDRQIDQVDPTAALFYMIILDDRIEVISDLPNREQRLEHHFTPMTSEQIQRELDEYRDQLKAQSNAYTDSALKALSKEIYDWLIGDLRPQLDQSKIKTLVFILDGKLRSISLPALYDGEQYIIENYNVALAPSLNLIDPKSLSDQNLDVLFGGLTRSLEHAEDEGNAISKILETSPANSKTKILIGDDFTQQNLEIEINRLPVPIVHLATHGKFGTTAKDTFILTSDGRLNINQLNDLLRVDAKQITPIEMLVLSACETAEGDERTALGLAGVAVRAGARSTLASLWRVNDQSTAELMKRFYQQLAKGSVTKAEALRLAQASLLKDSDFWHPYYWSAFVVVGNWL